MNLGVRVYVYDWPCFVKKSPTCKSASHPYCTTGAAAVTTSSCACQTGGRLDIGPSRVMSLAHMHYAQK